MSESTTTRMTTLDWLLAWTALVSTSSLFAMPFSVTPTFVELLQEAGTAVPMLTQWVLAGWLPILAALPPAALLFVAWRRYAAAPRPRRRMLATAALVGFAGLALCLTGYAAALFDAPAM